MSQRNCLQQNGKNRGFQLGSVEKLEKSTDFTGKHRRIKTQSAELNTNHAKDICDSFNEKCQGFVITTVLKKNGRTQIISYLKNKVNSMLNSKSTSFFVKRQYSKNIEWRTV